MRPRRFKSANKVFRLEGGNEDNDLWVRQGSDHEGYATIISVWQPTEEERRAIAEGANIELCVWTRRTPPVSIIVTSEELGK